MLVSELKDMINDWDDNVEIKLTDTLKNLYAITILKSIKSKITDETSLSVINKEIDRLTDIEVNSYKEEHR